jgi:hypothetical protein
MDTWTLITSITSSLGISIATASWLSKQLVTHRLAKDLEAYKVSWQKELEGEKAKWQRTLEEAKAGWQRELEKDKANWQGEIHKGVEEYLGEKSAEREYNLEARKRLYSAIGPLRFQLLLACRDVSTRINNYGSDDLSYSMNTKGYYGQSTLYRLLRPIAISELIERQITYADFSVDPTGVELLRFKKAAFMAFTDGDIILNHPNADWYYEKEHVFSGTLSRLASALIIRDEATDNKERPMHFHEFQSFISDPPSFKEFSPFKEILNDFTIAKKPIFWIRLVCFGYICNEYLGHAGTLIGFEKRQFDVHKLLLVSKDSYTRSNIEKYMAIFQPMINMSL